MHERLAEIKFIFKAAKQNLTMKLNPQKQKKTPNTIVNAKQSRREGSVKCTLISCKTRNLKIPTLHFSSPTPRFRLREIRRRSTGSSFLFCFFFFYSLSSETQNPVAQSGIWKGKKHVVNPIVNTDFFRRAR